MIKRFYIISFSVTPSPVTESIEETSQAAAGSEFEQKIGGVQIPNMTSPVTVKQHDPPSGRYWFSNSETSLRW